MEVWEILEFQGRSQAWLAEMMEVDKSLVSRLRSGDRNWTDELKERAARALGVPVSVAFSVSEPEVVEDVVG